MKYITLLKDKEKNKFIGTVETNSILLSKMKDKEMNEKLLNEVYSYQELYQPFVETYLFQDENGNIDDDFFHTVYSNEMKWINIPLRVIKRIRKNVFNVKNHYYISTEPINFIKVDECKNSGTKKIIGKCSLQSQDSYILHMDWIISNDLQAYVDEGSKRLGKYIAIMHRAKSDNIEENPKIKYHQKNENTCLVCSICSAFHYLGLVNLEVEIYNKIEEYKLLVGKEVKQKIYDYLTREKKLFCETFPSSRKKINEKNGIYWSHS